MPYSTNILVMSSFIHRQIKYNKLEEASTHKSAKIHSGNVFVTRDLDQNKWVSRTDRGTSVCIVAQI